MFRFIGDFLSRLWRFSNFWRVSPIGEARIGSPLAGGLLFLFLLFCTIGLILTVLGWVFGFDLGDVDVWLDSQAGWMKLVGAFLIQKALMAFVLLMCVAIAAAMLMDEDSRRFRNWWRLALVLLLCLAVGYCSAVNVIAPLDP